MDLEIRPEPAPGDEALLRVAFAALDRDPASRGRSAWWREGVRENLEGSEPDEVEHLS